MSFICHIHNYTEYNEECNVFSAFNPLGAVGSRHCGARGAVVGSVPCPRVSPQLWTLVARAGIRTHNLGLPQVSSPTLYPLGHDCPRRQQYAGTLVLGAPRPVERQGPFRGWGRGDTAGWCTLEVYCGAMPTSGPGSVASAVAVSYEAIRAAWLQLRMPYAPGASETVSVVPHSCLWRNSSMRCAVIITESNKYRWTRHNY